jgi:hypothetical protein
MAADDPLTSLRYSSETYNKRVRDVAITRDRVPRGKFRYLDSATNWAQGRANLYLPFRVPKEGNYFEGFKKAKADRKGKKQETRKKRVKKALGAKKAAVAADRA